jgi:bifunctional DNA-binding transcriptional regulator/antitoxin component of YhaV-PrlF toxin-antitoxin module
MMWTLEVEDDGVLTLPPDLLETMGWSEGTVLEWNVYGGFIAVTAQNHPETNIEVRLP